MWLQVGQCLVSEGGCRSGCDLYARYLLQLVRFGIAEEGVILPRTNEGSIVIV